MKNKSVIFRYFCLFFIFFKFISFVCTVWVFFFSFNKKQNILVTKGPANSRPIRYQKYSLFFGVVLSFFSPSPIPSFLSTFHGHICDFCCCCCWCWLKLKSSLTKLNIRGYSIFKSIIPHVGGFSILWRFEYVNPSDCPGNTLMVIAHCETG